ncbi:signal transduction histidine kinase [Flavimobilis soli]|uniref:histidine kinase n=1 Tax=Flavimobilis soli TaxID=442709 RepID=A0A2A9ECR6_9MICO|nr:nitrate- and nitrite sensing domain-containing protein [Flavimobilis soli]PFG36728.1 signal transduction histidine kinase [Flavimobilis soli]
MLRRLGVRGKILATLAVPVLVLVLGAGYLVVSAYDTWQYSRLQTSYLGVVVVEDDLIDALQQERWSSVAVATGRTAFVKDLAAARKATDDAVSKLDRALRQMDRKSDNAAVNETMARAVQTRQPEQLALARSLVDERIGWGTSGGGTTVRNLMSYYDTMIDAQLDLGDILATTVRDRGLGTHVVAYTNTNRLMNNMQVEAQSGQILIEDSFSNMDTEVDRRAVAVQMAEGTTVRTNAIRTVADLGYEGIEIPSLSASFQIARDGLLQAAPNTIPVQYRTQWEDNAAAENTRLRDVRDDLRQLAVDYGKSSQDAATRSLLLTLAAALAAVAVSVFIALTVARTITEPLRRLTDAAGRVRDELPRIVDEVAEPGKSPDVSVEKIEVTSQDEVGRLAGAFNEVNAVTLRVAREQALLRGSIAEMFINVARRDQVLLNRQLVFLDELERSEEDPGTLANLFRLDHLATRMRRNAESLLVLAGIESGRRVRAPMPLSDVVRTASSEIELYERVELDLHVDPLMLGHNALPAAHLIAELLENATVFSDPGTPVVVTVEEDSRWYTVAVLDEGLGMTDEELDEANEKASTYAASEIVGSQRLGLYVVGRLAYKLGASVRFSRPEGRDGTVARVMLPRALFIAADEVPLDEPVDVLSKDTREATEAWVAPEPAAAQPLSTRRNVEPEPPVAVPVDLDALTDGSTSTGMPRRKTRNAPETAAPSASLGAVPEADIVLPELAASELPSDFVAGANELWTPPSNIAGPASLPTRGGRSALPTRGGDALPTRGGDALPTRGGDALPTRGGDALPTRGGADALPTRGGASALPTRGGGSGLPTRGAAPTGASAPLPAEPTADQNGPIAPVPERAAVFSNFRTRRSLEFMGETVEPLPAHEQAETPTVPVVESSQADAFAPVEAELPALDEHQDAAVQAFAEAWAPSSDGASAHDAAESFHDAESAAWQPTHASELPAPTREDERLRTLGAHVGSIASAADVDDEAYPDVPTRRGRYARYEEETPAPVADAAPAPIAETAPEAVPAPEIDPELGFAIPGLVEDEVEVEVPDVEDVVYDEVAAEAYPGEHVDHAVEPAAQADEAYEAAPSHDEAAQYGAAAAQYDAAAYEAAQYEAPAAQYEAPAAQYGAPAARYDAPQAEAPAAHVEAPQAEPAVPQNEPAPAPADGGFLPMPAASADIAPFAVSPSGAALPSFSDVLGAAPAEPAPAAEPEKKRGFFGRKRKKKGAEAPAVTPPPAPAAAPQEQAGWGFAPAPAAPAAPAAEVFAPEPQAVASYEAPAAFAPAAPAEETAPLERRSPSTFTPQPIEPEGFTYSPPAFDATIGSAVEPESAARPAPSATAFFGPRDEAAPAAPSAPAAPAAPEAQRTSWGVGELDAELSARLALQAGIQEQALAELSQLSAYRPNQMAGPAASSSLTKRVRTEVPASTLPDEGSSKISRDAAELRARLSSFVSATNRARQEGDGAPVQDVHENHDPAPQSR